MSKKNDVSIRHLSLEGTTMAYREAGEEGKPVALFLHGNPTSSFIWRNILPLVASVAHCIAPDLIGFGASGKPDIAYRFFDHVRYLDALIEKLQIGSAYLVAQDWGTALAFHLAGRRPDFVRGLAFMEFIRPMPGWADFHRHDDDACRHDDDAARETFRKFRTPGEGEAMILEGNAFIEGVLPGGMLRKLSDTEMAAYRAPFPTPESRRPILALPRDLPIEGEPADVYETLQSAHAALAASTYPKLLFVGEPGALVAPGFASRFAASLKNCALVSLGPGRHFLQEDHPEAIGRSVAGWIAGIEAASSHPARHAA
jgi:haloalkane dehalogenase